MDIEVAEWLTEMIQQVTAELDTSPGMTIEVDDHPENWLQIIPEIEQSTGKLRGFILNYPYKGTEINPLEYLQRTGLKVPPDTNYLSWEKDGFATLWIRPDVPLVGLALFAGSILETIGGAGDGYEVNVQILRGL